MKTSTVSMKAQSLASLALSAEKRDRKYAYRHIPQLSGPELLYFAQEVSKLRGLASGLRRAISEWYAARSPEDLLEDTQESREKHARLIRLAHPRPASAMHSLVLQRLVNAGTSEGREVYESRQ